MCAKADPPRSFWQSGLTPPSPSSWASWKTSFLDYLFLIDAFSSIKLSAVIKLKLLRQHLGDEGQRVFDSLDLSTTTFEEAMAALNKLWGLRTNVFLGRYHFCRLRQENGEPLETFLTRLRTEVQACDYSSIPARRFEEAALLQQLIVGVADKQVQEKLLLEPSQKLTWDRACDIARSLDNTRHQLRSLPELHASEIVVKLSPSPSSNGLSKCLQCYNNHHRNSYTLCLALAVICNKE